MRQRFSINSFATSCVSSPVRRMSTFTADRSRSSKSDGLLIWSRNVTGMVGTRPWCARAATYVCVQLRRNVKEW
jgi:hypothetical protein